MQFRSIAQKSRIWLEIQVRKYPCQFSGWIPCVYLRAKAKEKWKYKNFECSNNFLKTSFSKRIRNISRLNSDVTLIKILVTCCIFLEYQKHQNINDHTALRSVGLVTSKKTLGTKKLKRIEITFHLSYSMTFSFLNFLSSVSNTISRDLVFHFFAFCVILFLFFLHLSVMILFISYRKYLPCIGITLLFIGNSLWRTSKIKYRKREQEK